jgi:hypothetical protein
MNEISVLYDYVINEFRLNPLVNTITTVVTSGLDINKENIYPLVNIDLVNSTISYPDAEMLSVNFQITVVQQRDVIPTVLDNKLLLNSNWRDNINETHSIANTFISKIMRQLNLHNINVEFVTAITFFDESYINGLDGCQFGINLTIPNNTSC